MKKLALLAFISIAIILSVTVSPLFGIVLLLIALGQPVYVLIGSVAAYLLLNNVFDSFSDLTVLVEKTRDLADKELLLAIPFFIVAGTIMTEGDIARRLIAFAKAIFGWLPGGLAISATFACVFFAAISGSSPVTVIAIGSIMFPAMVQEGYSERFSSGLVTSAGSLGILIPPSIPMIVYAIADPTMFNEPDGGGFLPAGSDVDLGVTDLFLAGVGPGLLIALIFSTFAIVEGLRRKVPRSKFSLREIMRTGREGIWALLLPVLILGGIYSGAFTATAAACVAVVYSVVVERFIHRSISFKNLNRVFAECTVLIGALLLILALAQGFNTYLVRDKVAETAAQMIVDAHLGPIMFLLVVNVVLLIAGCFMDILSAILILVPLLSPIAAQLGIHPLHLGVVFIVNLEIGYLTPPLGINLFVSSTLFGKSLGEIIRGVVPFTLLMLSALIVITYLPMVSIGPVSLFHGGEFAVPFPAQHLALEELDIPPPIQMLANAAEGGADSGETALDRGEVIDMAALLAQTMTELEEEVCGEYNSVAELLFDFRRIADGVPLRDLCLDLGDDEAEGPSETPNPASTTP